jgi:ELL-associated factor
MAKNFGLGPGPHELKIGSSFTGGGPKYQTIRYDFKPASVDPTKKSKVEIGESNSLSVTVPHSNGTTETTFKGNLKEPGHKECILIIDRNTGEITLEKLSGHMLLKKTRQERPGKQSAQFEHLVNPPITAEHNHQHLPPPGNGNAATSNSNTTGINSIAAKSNTSRPGTPVSSFKRDSPAGTPKPLSRCASPHIPNNSSTTLSQAAATMAAKPAKVDLSESSSSSSSSGGDSESDFDDVPNAPAFQQKPMTVNPSMPSFLDSAVPSPPPLRPVAEPQKQQQPNLHLAQQPPPQSVPRFLNDDLQLSESDDDSD